MAHNRIIYPIAMQLIEIYIQITFLWKFAGLQIRKTNTDKITPSPYELAAGKGWIIFMPDSKDAVTVIREAEDEAVKRRQSAIENARGVTAEADKKAAELLRQANEDAEALYKKIIAEADKSAAAYMEKAAADARVKADKLKADSAERVKKAGALIAERALGK